MCDKQFLTKTKYITLNDETCEKLDEKEEPIIIRMISIRIIENGQIRNMLFDSKERFYIFKNTNGLYSVSNIVHTSDFGVFHGFTFAHHIINEIHIDDPILKYFYDNRNEYWPTFGLTNFELK